MKGGTLNFVMTIPLTRPGRTEAARTISEARAMVESTGMFLARNTCMSLAALTEARPMTKPTERSMPPVMMTKVSAAARRKATVWICNTFWKLTIDRKFLPVKLKTTSIRTRKKAAHFVARARPSCVPKKPLPPIAAFSPSMFTLPSEHDRRGQAAREALPGRPARALLRCSKRYW